MRFAKLFVEKINCEDLERATEPVPAPYLPANYKENLKVREVMIGQLIEKLKIERVRV